MKSLIFSPSDLPTGVLTLGQLSSTEANRVRNEDIGLFPLKLQNPHISLERLSQYKVARQCLSHSLRAQGIEIEDWSTLKQINYAGLKDFPHIQVSLAHTREHWGLAWACPRSRPIGVDLEEITRPIKEQAQRHFLQDGEKEAFPAQTQLLELWSAKEACFKAASPRIPSENLVLKQLRLTPGGEFFFENRKMGHWKQIRQSFLTETFLISFAWTTTEH